MNDKKILIKNGNLVSSENISKQDILISNGKISEIGSFETINADHIIDASDKYIFPGIIDPQVHFRDPGLTHKEDLRTGSMAAASAFSLMKISA